MKVEKESGSFARGSSECLFWDVPPWKGKATQLLKTSKANSCFSCPTSWCWTCLLFQQGLFFQACQLAYLVNFSLDSASHVPSVLVTHSSTSVRLNWYISDSDTPRMELVVLFPGGPSKFLSTSQGPVQTAYLYPPSLCSEWRERNPSNLSDPVYLVHFVV